MSTFTPSLNLEEPALGADVNSWNVPVNSNFTIIDAAIAGSTSVALAATNVSLTNVQSAFRIIVFTGTLTASVTVTLASITGEWVFDNQTTGAFAITVKAAAGDTGLIVLQGSRTELMSNGTVMKFANAASVAGRQGAVTLAVADVSGAAPLASPTFTGTATFAASAFSGAAAFSGATTVPTVATNDASTSAANTTVVNNKIAAQALPAQTGLAGRVLGTNGTSASWSPLAVTALGQFTSNGTSNPTVVFATNLTVVRASAGVWTVTVTGLANANYAVSVTGTSVAASVNFATQISAKTSSGFTMSLIFANGATADPTAATEVDIIVIGGL